MQPGATAHRVRRQLLLGRAVPPDHPSPSESGVGLIVLELQMQRNGLDFAALDRVVSRRHRESSNSHIATDEVILTALDRGAVTYLTKSESKDHLIDAIRAARTDTPYVGPRMALAMLNDSTVGRANLAPREKEVLVAWFVPKARILLPANCRSHRPPFAPICSEFGRSTPRWDGPPPPRLRWWPGPFRTASSTSTTSSPRWGATGLRALHNLPVSGLRTNH